MIKALAMVQVVIVVFIIGYGTYQLFKGNFEVTFATLPFLIVYFVFVTSRQRRAQQKREDDVEE